MRGPGEVINRELQRWQKFQRNLNELSKFNTFQKNRFPGLVDWQSWKGFDDFTKACPLTTKVDLEKDRSSNPPNGTNFTYSPEHYVRYSKTSGTTGEPTTWMDTQKDWQWMLENWKQIMKAAQVEAGSRCFFAFSFGPFLGFWTAYEATVQNGCIAIPGGGQSTEARLRIILENEVEYLFCTPTYAMRLIETAKELKISLLNHSLKKIIVAGECGGSVTETRQVIDQAWARESLFFDHYGMTEVGPVAYETPGGQGGLRILLDSYHAEVINPESEEHLDDGELGELVLTPLGRVGSAILRYRTGDLVRVKRGLDELGHPAFDLVGGILGRTDDMVVVRGVNLYPSAIDRIVRTFTKVAEYEVNIQESRGMKEVAIRAECVESVAHALEVAIHNALSLRIPVHCVPPKTLPRFEMKAKRWIKQIEKPR